MPQKVYLDENGGLVQDDSGQVYLDDNGEPVSDGGNAFGRFLSGAIAKTPFNPMNLARAARHPFDTISGIVTDPFSELGKAGSALKETVMGNDPAHPFRDRGIALLQALEHTGGAVPFIGKAGIEAGEKIGRGDIAGGAGELTGLASSAFFPRVMARVPGAAGTVGDALVSRAGRLDSGSGWEGVARGVTRRHGPAAIATGIGGPWAGAAVEAVQSPFVNRTAGRMLQGVGRSPEAMRSLLGLDAESVAAAEAADMRSAGLRGDIPRTRWNPKTATQTARETAYDTSRTVPRGQPQPRGVEVPPPGEYSTRGVGIEGGTLNQPEGMAGGFGDVRPELARGARHADELLRKFELARGARHADELLRKFGGRQPSMDALADAAPISPVADAAQKSISPAMRSLKDAPPDTWVGGSAWQNNRIMSAEDEAMMIADIEAKAAARRAAARRAAARRAAARSPSPP